MKDSQGCSEETALVRGEATPNDHADKQKLEKEGSTAPTHSSRRSFLGNVGGATVLALAAGIPLEHLFEGQHGQAEASVVPYRSNRRAISSWQY